MSEKKDTPNLERLITRSQQKGIKDITKQSHFCKSRKSNPNTSINISGTGTVSYQYHFFLIKKSIHISLEEKIKYLIKCNLSMNPREHFTNNIKKKIN